MLSSNQALISASRIPSTQFVGEVMVKNSIITPSGVILAGHHGFAMLPVSLETGDTHVRVLHESPTTRRAEIRCKVGNAYLWFKLEGRELLEVVGAEVYSELYSRNPAADKVA